jgi:uncharacterized membrane protein HdeD (DUF308 family)
MSDDGDGLGFKFWGGLIGVILAIAIGGMILFLIFSRAVYAFGFLGALIVIGGIAVLLAWLYDRKTQRRVGYD